MHSAILSNGRLPTIANLLSDLGDIPPDRVRFDPPPGRATEADLLRLMAKDDSIYELVDGTLVEKAMGVEESKLATWLIYYLQAYLVEHPIGQLTAPDGHYRLATKLVRAPDITYCGWEHATTTAEDRQRPIARTIPDIAIEVISRSNTPREMKRKRKEYFKVGTKLVWQVYPVRKTIEVYTSPGRCRTLTIDDTLEGGTVLPGFQLSLRTLFSRPTKESHRQRK
jgi:Uma2 family endonuclease